MRRARLGRGLGRRGGLIRIEAVHTGAQLPVLVPQLPIRFGEPFQAFGQAPRLEERDEGDEDS